MESKTFRKILILFIPIFLELLLINLLSSIDTIMLSRYDELCVDAVGTASSTLSLLTVLIVISSNGVAITVGQFLGGEKKEEAKGILSQGVFFNFFLGLVLMMIFFFGNGLLLKLANTPDAFYDLAKQYMRIYAIALPFQAITQVIAANFRAYGKPFYMTIVSILSNGINVLLNWLFIFGIGIFPELGIQGAAIATVISLAFKTVVGIILNAVLIKSPIFPRRIDGKVLLAIVKIGGPSALESFVYCSANFILVAALNGLSNPEITSRIYINLVLGYIYMFSSALASSNSIFVARYVGAHEYKEAKKVTIKTTLLGLSVILTLVTLMLILADPLFTVIAGNSTLNDRIKSVLPIVYLLEIGRCINLIVINAQKSAGDVIYPVVIAIISMFLIMAGGSWLFAHTFSMGLAGIILAQALDEFARGILSLIRWLRNSWMNKSLIKEEHTETPALGVE